jgi:lipopolysaccharide/colanic/teichoic acid biosynthesis glycosyltransferase
MEQISFGNKSAAMSSLLTLAQKILGGILTRAEICNLWHAIRLDVVRGIAGLWQIYRCASLTFDDCLRPDISYIERRGQWLDICLLFKTVFAVLAQRGAH